MAKRKRSRQIFQRRPFLAKIGFLAKAGFFFFLIGVIAFFGLLLYYSKDLPRPEKFSERRLSQPTKIYDHTGQTILYTIFGEERREIISFEAMPDSLKNAVIATEDKNFYTHVGIDIEGIARAILVDLRTGKPTQGASTIPQLLIRSTFLTTEKTIERKVREIILSLELDWRYSKEQILEWFLNQVPFGSNAYGVEAASQTFFSKSTQDLTLAESAILASLIQAPSRLSPYGENKDLLMARKDYVLDRMIEEGFITPEEAEKAKQEELNFAKPSAPIVAPHFVLYVKNYLVEKYGEEYLKNQGLNVYTTLDVGLQKAAEQAVETGAQRNTGFRSYNAALVALNPQNGRILAMVGSKDYFDTTYPQGCIVGADCLYEPEFNVVTLGLRQPGSAFKPIVYATAFEKGYDDTYIVVDELTNFGIWGGQSYIPRNYDGLFRGPVTLREALAQSLNVPSVKVLMYLAHIKDSVEMAKKMGITTLKEPSYYGPSLVLGGGEVSLLDLTSAYGVFATDGLKVSPSPIIKIEDNKGNLKESHNPDPKRVVSSSSAQLVTNILSDNEARTPVFGPRSSLYVNDKVAAKTGTTQFYNNAWTIGYNNKIAVGVWAGNNDNSPSYNQPGVVLAGPIWKNFMTQALEMLGQ